MSTERHDDDGELPEPRNTAGPSDILQHGDGPERPARRPRLVVAAVATAVLLAGGGGAWWAAAAGGGDNSASPAPLRLDGPGLSASVTGGGPTDGSGAAFRLTGKLPDGPDKAAIYRTSGSVTQADVTRLASLLGMSGAVTSDHGSWRVGGTTDGGGPSLLVSKAAPGTWSYTKYGPPTVSPRSDDSTSTQQTAPSPGVTSSGADAGTEPVSAAKAEAVAKPVLDGLGLSDASVNASQTVGAIRTVSADPKVGGLPTHGWSTSLEVGSDGAVTLGYGRLSDVTKGATYPVVSAAAALKELNATPIMHPDYGASSCRASMPEQQNRTSTGSAGSTTRSTQAPASPMPTISPTSPGVEHSTPCLPITGGGHGPAQVSGAHFGLALEYVSGVQTLVPAWLFDTKPAGTTGTTVVAQAAVDPSYIQGSGPGGTATVSPTAPGSLNPGGPMLPRPSASPSNANSPHRVPVDAYTAGGSTLTLTYSGGLCDTYKASASETGTQVSVSVIATPKKPGTMCPMVIRPLTQKVTLDHPLGARKVIDTSDGHPIAGTVTRK